jgi:hypothetical protein
MEGGIGDLGKMLVGYGRRLAEGVDETAVSHFGAVVAPAVCVRRSVAVPKWRGHLQRRGGRGNLRRWRTGYAVVLLLLIVGRELDMPDAVVVARGETYAPGVGVIITSFRCPKRCTRPAAGSWSGKGCGGGA